MFVMKSELFFELIQVALGRRKRLSREPSAEEWAEIYAISKKQAVVGIAFLALEKLNKEGQKPPVTLLYEWIAAAEQIKVRNEVLNGRCGEITKLFTDAGFRSCILKGQGNALMYPVPESRTSGDIDIWVEGRREDIKKYVIARYPGAIDGAMHIAFQYEDDVEIEAHYVARRTSIPKYNKRLQAWMKNRADEQFSNHVSLPGEDNNDVCVPTTGFNVVYQMSHMMGHFFVEGIGLRHFVDYFYVLKKLHEEGCTEDYVTLFKHLGFLKFAKGVMWVEKEILGLSREYLICEPDEIIGRVILKEMEEGGNFGMYDERYAYRRKGYLARGIVDGYRLLKLAYYFPQDSLWKLVRKVENQRWKI